LGDTDEAIAVAIDDGGIAKRYRFLGGLNRNPSAAQTPRPTANKLKDLVMQTDQLLGQALKLNPAERFELVDRILYSLDQPDPAIDRAWQDEALRRLAEHRAGKVQGIAADDVLGSD
jgi:putative addiction module component (TIGR02574 family)